MTDGYPESSVWRCEGFFLASHREWGILGHRDLLITAVLDPRLLRLFAGEALRLADDLERGEERDAGPLILPGDEYALVRKLAAALGGEEGVEHG